MFSHVLRAVTGGIGRGCRLEARTDTRRDPPGGAASPECGPPPTPRPGHEPLSHCAGVCGEGESQAVTMQIRPWSDVQVSLT